jgi:1-deoxy-D-xylulose-5-phosphate synthase
MPKSRPEPQNESLLDSIGQPSDLRKLDYSQLRQLSDEIRDFIVRKVARTGGHLGSNLGAVELTLALHRSFDSPKDILLWDTGHQAYVHKIVTGRKHLFPSLRQKDGLSGYPSRAESEHDWIENSHASTVLSYAHGLATSVEQAGTDSRVVAVIGDGSMTGGMAFEALNNLGQSNSRVVIVLNDNGRSYAPTIGRLSESLSRIRGNPRYLTARNAIERGIKATPVVGGLAAKSVKGMKAAVREAIEPFAFFEALGVRYIGPIDGHDIADMETAFRDAAQFDGPIVVHVLTQKGLGYAPAVEDDEKHLHDVKVFDPDLGPQPTGKAGDYTEAFTDALLAIGEQHPQVHAITAAMPGPTGLIPFQERFPERFHDVGIAEQHAVTAAAGMAMGGLRPVVAVYSTFFTRAFDQAMFDVGLHNLPVVFALDRAGITGDNGPSHHGVLDLTLALRIPGMTVFAPSSAQEVDVMMKTAITLEGPSTVRWPGGKARQVTIDNIGSGLHARRVIAGDEVCIIGVGRLLEAAEDAATLLQEEGISVTVWDPRVVKPLDMNMIEDTARHRLVVVVEDGMRIGGVGSAVTAALEGLESVDRPMIRTLGTPDAYIAHAKPAEILHEAGLDAAGIHATVRAALGASDTVVLP